MKKKELKEALILAHRTIEFENRKVKALQQRIFENEAHYKAARETIEDNDLEFVAVGKTLKAQSDEIIRLRAILENLKGVNGIKYPNPMPRGQVLYDSRFADGYTAAIKDFKKLNNG